MAVAADVVAKPVVQLLLGRGQLLLGVVMPLMSRVALVIRLGHRVGFADTGVPPRGCFVQLFGWRIYFKGWARSSGRAAGALEKVELETSTCG